jgi:hypothetical protein
MALGFTTGQIGVEDINYKTGAATTFDRITRSDSASTETINRIMPTDVRKWGTEANAWNDALAAAITAIGAENVQLLVTVSQTLAANLTVPANVELIFVPGAVITVGAYTATFNGHIQAGLYKILSWTAGSGAVNINNNPYVYLQWFGALNDGTGATATTAAFTSCVNINLTADQEKPVILVPPGTYLVNEITTTETDISIVGMYPNATKEIGTTTSAAVLKSNGGASTIDINNIHVENIYFDGASTGTVGIEGINLTVKNCTFDEFVTTGIVVDNTGSDNLIEDCRFKSCAIGINLNNVATDTVQYMDRVEGCWFSTSTTYDIIVAGAGKTNIKSNKFYNGDDKSISITGNGCVTIESNLWDDYDGTIIETTTAATDPTVIVRNNFAFQDTGATGVVAFVEHNRGHLIADGNEITGWTGSAGMAKAFYLKDGFRAAHIGYNVLQTEDSENGLCFTCETATDIANVSGHKDYVWSHECKHDDADLVKHIPVHGNEGDDNWIKRQYFLRSIKAIVIATLTETTDPGFTVGKNILGGTDDPDYYVTTETISSTSEGDVLTVSNYVSAATRQQLAAGFSDDNSVIELVIQADAWTAGGPIMFYVSIGCIEWSEVA